MKLLHLDIFRHMGCDALPIRLANLQDLSFFSYWQRNTISEHFNFTSRTFCQRTNIGLRQTIELKDDIPFLAHIYVRSDCLSALVIVDKEYPVRVAFSFLNRVLSDFDNKYNDKWKLVKSDQSDSSSFLKELFDLFQNPKDTDKILKIQDTLDDIKIVMHKNIEDILKRGETIDELIKKSEDLSNNSKLILNRSKKLNSCCKSW